MDVERARRLRRDATDAERRLWGLIRDRRIGVKFRRQHPIGRYVVDFACEALRLVVEVDGGQHGNRRDQVRTAELERIGWRVVRFWNNEVLANPEGVLTVLIEAISSQTAKDVIIRGAAPPSPLPRRGRGTG